MAISRFNSPTIKSFTPLPYQQMQSLLMQGENTINERQRQMAEASAKVSGLNVLSGDEESLKQKIQQLEDWTGDYTKKYQSLLDPMAGRDWQKKLYELQYDKDLNALAQSYANMEKEQAIVAKMTAEGKTPLFAGKYKDWATIDPETGERKIYQPGAEEMLNYTPTQEAMWNQLQVDGTNGSSKIELVNDPISGRKIPMMVTRTSGGGLSKTRITDYLTDASTRYLDTNEGKQQMRYYTELYGNADAAKTKIEEELLAAGMERYKPASSSMSLERLPEGYYKGLYGTDKEPTYPIFSDDYIPSDKQSYKDFETSMSNLKQGLSTINRVESTEGGYGKIYQDAFSNFSNNIKTYKGSTNMAYDYLPTDQQQVLLSFYKENGDKGDDLVELKNGIYIIKNPNKKGQVIKRARRLYEDYIDNNENIETAATAETDRKALIIDTLGEPAWNTYNSLKTDYNLNDDQIVSYLENQAKRKLFIYENQRNYRSKQVDEGVTRIVGSSLGKVSGQEYVEDNKGGGKFKDAGKKVDIKDIVSGANKDYTLFSTSVLPAEGAYLFHVKNKDKGKIETYAVKFDALDSYASKVLGTEKQLIDAYYGSELGTYDPDNQYYYKDVQGKNGKIYRIVKNPVQNVNSRAPIPRNEITNDDAGVITFSRRADGTISQSFSSLEEILYGEDFKMTDYLGGSNKVEEDKI